MNASGAARVLVTGASGGIGTAICQVMARRGASVILHYRSDRAAAEATQRALPGEGHALVEADLGDPADAQRLWQEVSALGAIDALVNNAGIFPDHPPLTTEYATGRQPGSGRSRLTSWDPRTCHSVPHGTWRRRAEGGS